MGDCRVYIRAKKWNLKSYVDKPTHTKQMRNLFCIV